MYWVLVSYATRYGSTRDVAQAVAATLQDRRAQVVCRAAREIPGGVEAFDLVVLGAPLYRGRWHRDAHRFLSRQRAYLPAVAVFGMGPRDDTAAAWSRARAQLDHALAKHPWLAPTSVAVFGGVDPPGMGRRDLRDWTAIAAWAAHLAGTGPRPTIPSD